MIKSLKELEKTGSGWLTWLNRKDVSNTESTIGIDTDEMKMIAKSQDEKVEFTILDFAGQLEYCATHQVSHF